MLDRTFLSFKPIVINNSNHTKDNKHFIHSFISFIHSFICYLCLELSKRCQIKSVRYILAQQIQGWDSPTSTYVHEYGNDNSCHGRFRLSMRIHKFALSYFLLFPIYFISGFKIKTNAAYLTLPHSEKLPAVTHILYFQTACKMM